jgi:hypothetical protein
LCPERHLSPHERMIGWLFLYQLTAWQKAFGRGPWDDPQERNPWHHWERPLWAGRHKNTWNLCQISQQHSRKHFSDRGKQVGTCNLSILLPATSSTLQKPTLCVLSNVLACQWSAK